MYIKMAGLLILRKGVRRSISSSAYVVLADTSGQGGRYNSEKYCKSNQLRYTIQFYIALIHSYTMIHILLAIIHAKKF
jgi:hypothetical protein